MSRLVLISVYMHVRVIDIHVVGPRTILTNRPNREREKEGGREKEREKEKERERERQKNRYVDTWLRDLS